MPIPLVCDTESGLVIAKATPKDEAGLADDSKLILGTAGVLGSASQGD